MNPPSLGETDVVKSSSVEHPAYAETGVGLPLPFIFFAGVTLIMLVIMLIILCFSLCFVGCHFWFDCTSGSRGLERFVSEMTDGVLVGLLNRTHSFVIAAFIEKSGFICCSVFSSCPPLRWYVTVESAR